MLRLPLTRAVSIFLLAMLSIVTIILAIQFSVRQSEIAKISANNLAFVGSSAVVEMLRARSAIDKGEDDDEIRLRVSIFKNRTRILSEGEFRRFADRDRDGPYVVANAVELADRMMREVHAGNIDSEGLSLAVDELERPLLQLASRANQAGGDDVGRRRQELQSIFSIMIFVAGSLIVLATFLIIRISLNERLLQQGNEALQIAKNEYKRLAMSDHLTGIANRAQFLQDLEAGTAKTIALIDLDGFKNVNDVHGHAVGDEVLIEAARRLSNAFSGSGVVARLGGDEFAVLSVTDRRYFRDIVHAATTSLRQPFETTVGTVRIGASAGVADGSSNEGIMEVIARADSEMYRDKRSRSRSHSEAPVAA